MSDAISRSSTIMAKCSAAFNPQKFSNFKTPNSNGWFTPKFKF